MDCLNSKISRSLDVKIGVLGLASAAAVAVSHPPLPGCKRAQERRRSDGYSCCSNAYKLYDSDNSDAAVHTWSETPRCTSASFTYPLHVQALQSRLESWRMGADTTERENEPSTDANSLLCTASHALYVFVWITAPDALHTAQRTVYSYWSIA